MILRSWSLGPPFVIAADSEVDFELDGSGARLVVDRDRACAEIARMRGTGDVALTTDEILALTRR